jgi:hypothetical protein
MPSVLVNSNDFSLKLLKNSGQQASGFTGSLHTSKKHKMEKLEVTASLACLSLSCQYKETLVPTTRRDWAALIIWKPHETYANKRNPARRAQGCPC